MRKAYQVRARTRLLPNISHTSSRTALKSTDSQHSKENSNLEKINIPKITIQPALQSIAKKDCLKMSPFLLEDFIEKKLSLKEKQDIPTQPKMSKPWIGKEVDLNKLTVKANLMKAVQTHQEKNQILRRKSCYNTSAQNQNLSNINIINNQTVKLPINSGSISRATSMPRGKISSCKIAIKKGVFPMSQKRFQEQKIAEFFQQSDMISTIYKKEQADHEDLFMQLNSYLKIDQ